MGKLIDQQVAIDAINNIMPTKEGFYEPSEVLWALMKLPSAQPENIRCYECKHGTHSGCGNVYICHVSPELVMKHTGNFYCGYAERKTDD